MGFGREAYRRGIESIGAAVEETEGPSQEEMLRRRDALMKSREKIPPWGVAIFKHSPGEGEPVQVSKYFDTEEEASLWYGDVMKNPEEVNYAATWGRWKDEDFESIINEYRDPSYTEPTPAPPGQVAVRAYADSTISSVDDDDGPSTAMLAVGAGLVLGGLVLGAQGKKGRGKK